MALIQCMEPVGSPEKSVGRATLNLGMEDNIGVGGLGGGRDRGYWVTRGRLSPNAKGSGGHCGCE